MRFDLYRKINDEQMNVGDMPDANVVLEYKNEACGDNYVLFLKVVNNRIEDASFTTTGCGFGLASLAIACERAKGKTLEEAENLSPQDIESYIEGFPPRRKRYPETAIEVLREGVQRARLAPAQLSKEKG